MASRTDSDPLESGGGAGHKRTTAACMQAYHTSWHAGEHTFIGWTARDYG